MQYKCTVVASKIIVHMYLSSFCHEFIQFPSSSFLCLLSLLLSFNLALLEQEVCVDGKSVVNKWDGRSEREKWRRGGGKDKWGKNLCIVQFSGHRVSHMDQCCHQLHTWTDTTQ